MKVLNISTDRNIFKKESAVRARMIEYGALFDELHIVVFTKSRRLLGPKFKKEQISKNVWVYATNSWSRWFYGKTATNIGSKIIAERKFEKTKDVITVQDPFDTGVVGRELKKKFGLPLHVQVHTDFLSPHFKKHSLLNRARVRLGRLVLLEADAIRVVSERIKRSIEEEKITAAPISVVPIFVDVKEIIGAPVQTNLKEKYPQFNFIILVASRFTREKNIPLAFEVMRRIIKAYPRAGLVVVGDGPEKNALVSLAKRLNISSNVVFLPWQDDIVSFYKTANMFLSTSEYEGYGLAMVEAIAAHCPVVATDAGIAPELLENGEISFVCPVGDASCLFDNVNKLIANTALRERFVHEAIERLDRVTFRSKDEYLKKYRENVAAALEKKS